MRIAKIIGLTVVVSSFILGAFILASSYLQARASCDQMQTLDSILEKELMLETLQVSILMRAFTFHFLIFCDFCFLLLFRYFCVFFLLSPNKRAIFHIITETR